MRIFAIFCIGLSLLSSNVSAQTQNTKPEVHVIYLGGNDCPPCVAWRAVDFPKLQKTEVFKQVKFSFVTKAIKSPVPSTFFLPSEVKPFKEKLDIASNGRSGSPQFAVLIDGEVFDYFHGTRSAEEFEQMLLAIRNGGQYPFQACKRRGHCKDPAA